MNRSKKRKERYGLYNGVSKEKECTKMKLNEQKEISYYDRNMSLHTGRAEKKGKIWYVNGKALAEIKTVTGIVYALSRDIYWVRAYYKERKSLCL